MFVIGGNRGSKRLWRGVAHMNNELRNLVIEDKDID